MALCRTFDAVHSRSCACPSVSIVPVIHCRENLSINQAVWWMRAICINFWIVILLFFLTTPSMFLNLLNEGGYKKAVEEVHVSQASVLVAFAECTALGYTTVHRVHVSLLSSVTCQWLTQSVLIYDKIRAESVLGWKTASESSNKVYTVLSESYFHFAGWIRTQSWCSSCQLSSCGSSHHCCLSWSTILITTAWDTGQGIA